MLMNSYGKMSKWSEQLWANKQVLMGSYENEQVLLRSYEQYLNGK